MSCIAKSQSLEGCRELKRVYAPLKSGMIGLSVAYVDFLGGMLVSGLCFVLDDGQSVEIGYISSLDDNAVENITDDQTLWIVASPFGIQYLSFRPPSKLLKDPGKHALDKAALVKMSLKTVKGVYLGLDVGG